MTTTDHIRRCLAATPDLMALLPDALGTRSRGPQTSRPVPGSRPPVDLDILDLTDHRPKETVIGFEPDKDTNDRMDFFNDRATSWIFPELPSEAGRWVRRQPSA